VFLQGWKDGISAKNSINSLKTGRGGNNHLDRGEPQTGKTRQRQKQRQRLHQKTYGHGTDTWDAGEGRQNRPVQRSRRDIGQGVKASSGEGYGGEDPRGENPVETKRKTLTIALAGNANVGKSVIFNYLTGLHQHIGNWPGKTVERAEGTLFFKGYLIDIIDLPGIYSLSTFSLEELVSREYIAFEKPDLVINVVDASVLERNLFFTLQLIELETPMVLALNQIDIAAKKGIQIDHKKLERILGIPVVPTVAIKGIGVYALLERAVEVVEKGGVKPVRIKYGKEVEEQIQKLTQFIEKVGFKYPARWTAIKLLERDEEIQKQIGEVAPEILEKSRKLAEEIENLHGHPCETVIVSERYETARCIAAQVQEITPGTKQTLTDRIHNITTHIVYGYLIMLGVLLAIFYSIFTFGDITSGYLEDLLYRLEPVFQSFLGEGVTMKLIWGGIMESIIAGVTIALPYIVPFYLVLFSLEDSGYLSRIAFLMDAVMHKIGLHGKAFIPVMLAFGCNVPACLGCKIMETERERLLAIFVVTLVPCAAVSVVVLGLVGKYVGLEWALILYMIDLAIILTLGRIAFKALPGEPTGLIMEMNEIRVPHLKTVLTQTWFRLKEFIIIAFPLIIVSGFIIKLVEVLGYLNLIVNIMSPVTVNWLGLEPEMGISLLFGIFRKELALIMLATVLGNLAVLSPLQMVVFTLVVMLYIPCVATTAVLVKETGWKNALLITVSEVLFALLVGGIVFRVFSLLGLP